MGGAHAPVAVAAIHLPALLDGPSARILDVGGVALAPDGTGGVVYRKVGADGLAHVYVVKFDQGVWSAPIQVDAGQAYAASEPVIGAADGGRLLVAWVEPFETINGVVYDQLRSAYMGPGATGFGQAINVDPSNVGAAGDVSPQIAMAPDGAAYVVYRVVTNTLQSGNGTLLPIEPMRPGDELVEFRVARFQGTTWASLGTVNRAPGDVTLRAPSASNAPVIGIDAQGDAVVAWQEPDASGVARIWARRIFGSTLGNVLAVSPTTVGGVAVDVDADAPALSVGPDGSAVVAFRLPGGTGSPFTTGELMAARLPSLEDAVDLNADATQFGAAFGVYAGANIGLPSVMVNQQSYVSAGFRVAVAGDGVANVIDGTASGTIAAAPSYGTASADPVLTSSLDAQAGAVCAFPSAGAGGYPALSVREDFATGDQQDASLQAPVVGPLDGVALGVDGAGDGLVAFRQGPADAKYVEGDWVQAPPAQFAADFGTTQSASVTQGANALLQWNTPTNWSPGLTYAVYLDGRPLASGLAATGYTIGSSTLGIGAHSVQVLATDATGQQSLSAAVTLTVTAANTTTPKVTKAKVVKAKAKAKAKKGRASKHRATKRSGTKHRGAKRHGTRRTRSSGRGRERSK